jgi:hypothetical protein
LAVLRRQRRLEHLDKCVERGGDRPAPS